MLKGEKTDSIITIRIATLVTVISTFVGIIGILIGTLLMSPALSAHETRITRTEQDVQRWDKKMDDMIKQINEIHRKVVKSESKKIS